jgi:lipoprotein-releasing system ATP-binding protein
MAGLVVQNVTKQFPTRSEPLSVLNGVSFELNAGENVAIVGPSGTGKSTLLHILGTLDRPTSGVVSLDGEDPSQLDDVHLASYRNHNIGFVFQDHHLLPQLSVLENVLIPVVAEGRPDAATVERARDLLERVGLSQRLDHRPAELSGGERQRVGVARALILRPKLLLADEPTGNLDRTNALAIGRLLVELQQQEQAMLVVVTHSPELASLLQRQYEMDEGVLRT